MPSDTATSFWNCEALTPLRHADAHRAAMLLQALAAEGRAGHPATSYLTSLTASEPPQPGIVAAVAFEAGVRLHLGEVAATSLKSDGAHPSVDPYLTQRTPNAWEPGAQTPYIEVDWARALSAARDAFAHNHLDIRTDLPGAPLLTEAVARAGSRAEALGHLFPNPIGNVVLDPVSTNALFLAEAMPGYADLDAALREHRLSRLAAG